MRHSAAARSCCSLVQQPSGARSAALGLALDARARLDETLLTVERARLQARDGVAEFSGTAGLAAPNRFAAEGAIANLDPARYFDV